MQHVNITIRQLVEMFCLSFLSHFHPPKQTHTHTHVHTHTHTHAHTHTHTRAHTHICAHAHVPTHTQTKERPPRLKRFTLKGLWRRWFSDRPTEKILPSQVEAQRANSPKVARSSSIPDHPAKQHARRRHGGTSSYHRRQHSDGQSTGRQHC